MPPAAITNTIPALPPYPLPPDVRQVLLSLAAESDVLFFGEMHGTQEVPRLIATLLPDLALLGYRGLALEMPADTREPLAAWGADTAQPVPAFFATPSYDGRGNAQALALVRAALQSDASLWELFCFDAAPDQKWDGWTARDAGMANNLADQRRKHCPGDKVVAICGNMHSRLVRKSAPGDWAYDFWPALAAVVTEREPSLAVRSVNVVFRTGTFYNVEVRTLGGPGGEPLAQAYVAGDGNSEHTLDLHLPTATAATFLKTPTPLPAPETREMDT